MAGLTASAGVWRMLQAVWRFWSGNGVSACTAICLKAGRTIYARSTFYRPQIHPPRGLFGSFPRGTCSLTNGALQISTNQGLCDLIEDLLASFLNVCRASCILSCFKYALPCRF